MIINFGMLLLQSGREISVIIVTDDYSCYKELKMLTTNVLFSYFNI